MRLNSAAVMELLFTNRVFFNRSDHRAISIGYCVISDDSKLSAGVTTMLFMLFGADGSYAFQYFHCLYRCFYRQYFRRYCRDVRRNEPVRLHHEARSKRLWHMLFMALIGIVLASLVNFWLKSEALMWAVTTSA